MASYNKVILVGNLTRDPELRFTPKGLAIAKLSIAVNRSWRNETGETKEEVTFVDLDAFGKQAETLCQYLKKGNPLLVEGRLRLDQWDDKQTGQKRSRLGVVVEAFQFLGGARQAGDGASEPAARRQQATPPPAAAEAPTPAAEPEAPPQEEDDVPF